MDDDVERREFWVNLRGRVLRTPAVQRFGRSWYFTDLNMYLNAFDGSYHETRSDAIKAARAWIASEIVKLRLLENELDLDEPVEITLRVAFDTLGAMKVAHRGIENVLQHYGSVYIGDANQKLSDAYSALHEAVHGHKESLE